MNLRKQLTGTGVAVVTPFTKDDAIDYESLGKVLDNLVANDVDYIVTMGTTGETPVLTREEKKEIIEFTYKHINGRLPIVVGVGGNSTANVADDLKYFPLDGAVAVLTASPYYNKPSQDGLFEHYKVVAANAPKPVILYNVPGRTGRNMNAATTLKLAKEVDNIAGIKEASGDMLQCMEILKARPEEFLVVSGDDALAFPQIACGMDGVISVAANCFPGRFSAMVKAALSADLEKAKENNDALMPVYNYLFEESSPAGVKAFMHEMGLLQNKLRLPGVPIGATLHEKVRRYLNDSV